VTRRKEGEGGSYPAEVKAENLKNLVTPGYTVVIIGKGRRVYADGEKKGEKEGNVMMGWEKKT